METLEQLKDIVKNSPEGATNYDGKNYFRFEMYEHGQAYLVLRDGVWTRGLPAYPVYSCRSLSDIKRIIELMEEVKALKANTVNCNGGVKCSNIPNNLAM